VAVKPAAYTWRQLAGAGTLAGISFWVSLFIAGQASPVELDSWLAVLSAVIAGR
jgi:Na+:H+ antiporter, NhaA family